MDRYPFIVVEGLDGSGKTMLRKGLFRLWQSLTGVIPLCVLTTNYLDPALAADLVEGKYSPSPDNREAYLRAVTADKKATLERLVLPALAHRPVIADRWLLSEMVFFSVKHDVTPALTYQAIAPHLAMAADLTFLLTLPAEASMARAQDRAGDAVRPDWDTAAVQTRARAAYDEVAARPGDVPLLGSLAVLDALRPPEDVLDDAWAVLAEAGLLWRPL